MSKESPALISVKEAGLDRPDKQIRGLWDAIRDAARRLDHDILDLEHLMVVGAENGIKAMAQAVPSLASFREALLDLLFDHREDYRQGGEHDEVLLHPDLVAALETLQKAEDPGEVMADIMQEGKDLGWKRPIIEQALAYARGQSQEVRPADTVVLEKTYADPTLSQHSSPPRSAPTSESLGGGQALEPQTEVCPTDSVHLETRAAPPLQLPLIRDLLSDSTHDLPLLGRDELLDQVGRILLRYQQPAVVVVGRSGSGKTAFVRGLARAAADGTIPAMAGFHFYQLKLLDLVAQGHQGQDIHNILDQLFTHIVSDARGVLVIDDLHMLIAKQGAPLMSDVIDTVKFHIKKGQVRALLTVDEDAWQKTISQDQFFGNEITVKTLPLLDPPVVKAVLAQIRERLQKHFHVTIDDNAVAIAATVGTENNADFAAPAAAIRALDEACALARSRMEDPVTEDHVRRSMAETEAEVAEWDRNRLASIERKICERVLGQEPAAEVLSRRVRLSKLKLDRKPNRPDGVFLCIGPSGVGKTEMARGLADALYDDESRLVRLDMSEYMEPHSVARIIGAPPGYVGYGEEGALTGPVSRLGHAVVLLDEIEKAHPQVLNLFLQVMDDGRLTDSKGRVVSFSDAVVIMTSNIGRELYATGGDPKVGFGAGDEPDRPVLDAVREHLLRVLPPEFVNRIDELIAFRVLDEEDIKRIASKMIQTEEARWSSWGKTLSFTDEVVDLVALYSYDPRLGARHVERNVERFVISLISDAAVRDGFEEVRELSLLIEDGQVCLDVDGTRFGCLSKDGSSP